jgi:phenylalanyl-tRNA synthetase beta chain
MLKLSSIYRIEPVKLVFPDGKVRITPDISERQTIAHTSYINSCTKLDLNTEEASALLQKMGHRISLSPTNPDEIIVNVPATRPDIFHECDIMEDAAVAYGFNNLPDVFPATSTVAQPLAIGKLSDVVRREWALAGWVEVLPLILVRLLFRETGLT